MPDKTPLIAPVLALTSKPRLEGISGGGKSSKDIQHTRLNKQRGILSASLRVIETQAKLIAVSNKVALVVRMYEDSYAPSFAPKDLLWSGHGTRLIAPYKSGYLAEIDITKLSALANVIETSSLVKELVDISRIKSIELLNEKHVLVAKKPETLFKKASKFIEDKKEYGEFLVWFVPFSDPAVRAESIKTTSKTLSIKGLEPTKIETSKSPSRLISIPDERALVEYIPPSAEHMDARARIRLIPPLYAVALEKASQIASLAASGRVIRIDPMTPLVSANAEEFDDNTILPNLGDAPIVGVIDGGRTARSYETAEAWRADDLIHVSIADTAHGNRVTSLAVNAHQLNPHLDLPKLFCRVGTVQVITKPNQIHKAPHPKILVKHLDQVMRDNPQTKIWSISANVDDECDESTVSTFAHALTVMSRRHKVLPIISAGNKGDKESLRISSPADCEAGLVVGGRKNRQDGKVGDICPKSRHGLGPDEMLKPDLSWFSTVKVIGNQIVNGTSYATPLISNLAAHTWDNLRDPSPDLVKALLINNCDLNKFDPSLGWGSPTKTQIPWECESGTVCLAWKSKVKAGYEHYWDNIAIPPSMLKDNVLRGQISLTAILDPGYLNYVGHGNYFMTRIEVSLQDAGLDPEDTASNILGSMQKNLSEVAARKIEHKWSPIRRHAGNFRGKQLSSSKLRLRTRAYTRDLWQLGLVPKDLEDLDVAFVLKFTSPNKDPNTYSSFVSIMRQNVQSAVVSQNIDINLG